MAEDERDVVVIGANLREKMVAVMGEVFGVAKRGQNTQGVTYRYQMAADIFPKVQRALRAHGVAFLAHEVSTEWLPTHESKSGGIVFVCMVKMQYRFHDTESDEVLSGDSSGLAFDSSDKGINKAKTAALKYFLKQTFLLAEEDDDSEIETLETKPDAKLALKRDQPATSAWREPGDEPPRDDDPAIAGFQASTDAKITDEHCQVIVDFCAKENVDFWVVFGKSFIGVQRLEDLTEHQFDIWRNVKTVMLEKHRALPQSGSRDIQRAEQIVNASQAAIRKQANANGISEGKQKRIFAIANGDKELIRQVLDQFSLHDVSEIPWKGDTYDRFCSEIEKGAQ